LQVDGGQGDIDASAIFFDMCQAAGLGSEGVGFAVEFLQQEVEPFADASAAGERAFKFLEVGGEAVELFGDVEALGDEGDFLLHALGIGRLAERFERFEELAALGLDGFGRKRAGALDELRITLGQYTPY